MHDYTILFQKDKIQLWPTDDMTQDEKLNAISRFIILLSLLGFVLTQTIRFIWIGIATLFLIVMYRNAQKTEEAFTIKTTRTAPTQENPLMNVLLPEINGNPNRGKALTYNPKTEKKIMEKVKSIYKIIQSKKFFSFNSTRTTPYNLLKFNHRINHSH